MTRVNPCWTCVALALLAAGCGVPRTPPAASAQPPAPVAVAPPATPASPKPAPAPKSASVAAAPAPKSPSVAAAPTPKSPPLAAAPAPKAPQVAAAPALDLKSLEHRLKETGAIGVLTKLSLKNQVDDLVQSFRAFHQGQRPPGLAELRPAFDLLLMKVLSLLQDKDPTLAKDIDGSRNVLWGVLTDRDKLASYN